MCWQCSKCGGSLFLCIPLTALEYCHWKFGPGLVAGSTSRCLNPSKTRCSYLSCVALVRPFVFSLRCLHVIERDFKSSSWLVQTAHSSPVCQLSICAFHLVKCMLTVRISWRCVLCAFVAARLPVSNGTVTRLGQASG